MGRNACRGKEPGGGEGGMVLHCYKAWYTLGMANGVPANMNLLHMSNRG